MNTTSAMTIKASRSASMFSREKMEFIIFLTDAKGVLNKKRQVNQAEGIDQSARDQRITRLDDALGLFENGFDNEIVCCISVDMEIS